MSRSGLWSSQGGGELRRGHGVRGMFREERVTGQCGPVMAGLAAMAAIDHPRFFNAMISTSSSGVNIETGSSRLGRPRNRQPWRGAPRHGWVDPRGGEFQRAGLGRTPRAWSSAKLAATWARTRCPRSRRPGVQHDGPCRTIHHHDGRMNRRAMSTTQPSARRPAT